MAVVDALPQREYQGSIDGHPSKPEATDDQISPFSEICRDTEYEKALACEGFENHTATDGMGHQLLRPMLPHGLSRT